MDEFTMTKLVKYGAISPELKWWGVTYVRINKDLRRERVVKIRLPFFGYGYDARLDEMAWGQRVLAWYGHTGFRLGWCFPEFA